MKYRKRPVTIDAFRWTGGPDQEEDPEWIVKAISDGIVYIEGGGTPQVRLSIYTLEGRISGSPGDYIIRGVKGEIYPCKPDIFEQTYERVEA